MLTIFRWLLRILSGLIALGVLGILVSYYFLERSVPDYNARYQIEGLNGPVEILRNSNNVPHILGDSDQDVYFALGFAHAQDRLWQMTLMRRTAQGRLSEIFGARTVKIDETMRRYDLYTYAQQAVALQDEPTKIALDAYARGVNQWIEEVNRGARGRGAPELFFFSNEIAAWSPADSLVILKLMALQMSGQMQDEVLRARVSMLLSPQRLKDVLPDPVGSAVTALPSYASLIDGPLPNAYASIPMSTDPLSPFQPIGMSGASNAWAAEPRRSAAGGSLLANDPHLPFQAPVLWYLARLQLQSGGVIGATIPGVPAVLIGRSESLGWGLTSSYADDQDIVMEKVNPANPEEYETATGPQPFTSRRSIITVKGGRPLTITLRWSQSGPIFPDSHMNLGAVTPAGHVPALQWTALTAEDRSMTAAIRLMQAKSVDEALEAGSLYVAPSQNLMLADQSRVAMQVIGALPERNALHPTQGRMPALGTNPASRWLGIKPYADNPRFDHPDSGILGNTNNKTVDAPFPDNLSFNWGDTQRIERWLTLMKTREVHTRESFIEAQLDTVSPAARMMLPLVGADLWFTGAPAAAGTPEHLRQRALDMLAKWNGEMNEHLPEPLIYMAWLRALNHRLIADELGVLADEFTHVDPVFIDRVFRNTDGAGVWCDVIQSAPIETCSDIARMALDEALIELGQSYGRTPESWRWGDAHQARQDHAVLGRMPFLGWFVNIRQSTSGGDYTLMRGRTIGTGPNPYLNVHGAGYRGVYDFADPDSSVFIISTGQSGHPLSRHYDDLGERWRRGEYVPMSLDLDLARAAAVGSTKLEPLER